MFIAHAPNVNSFSVISLESVLYPQPPSLICVNWASNSYWTSSMSCHVRDVGTRGGPGLIAYPEPLLQDFAKVTSSSSTSWSKVAFNTTSGILPIICAYSTMNICIYAEQLKHSMSSDKEMLFASTKSPLSSAIKLFGTVNCMAFTAGLVRR